MSQITLRTRYLLGGILILGFALRLAYVLGSQASPYFQSPIMDPLYHLQWARAFAAGETFQAGPFFRAPLYPWFLGTLLRAFGENLLLVRLIQAGLGTISCGLGFLLARRLFDVRAGLVCAFLIATNWVLIYFDGELLIPTLAIPLNLLALLWSVRLAQEPSPRNCTMTGLAWGFSAIARPNVLLFMPLLAAWLLARSKGPGKTRLIAGLALTLGTLAPILPLTIYNFTRGNDTVLISSQAGVNLWIGNNPQSDGSTAIVPRTRPGWWEGFNDSISLAEQAAGHKLKPSEVSSYYTGLAADYFSSQPAQALSHLAWKLRLLVADWELGNNADVRFFAQRFTPWMAALPPSIALLGPLALLGLFACRRRFSELVPLWGWLVVYGASVVMFFVCSRFRAPLIPVLAIFASHALVLNFDHFKARRWKPLAMAGGGFLALCALSMWTPKGADTTGSMGHWALGIAKLDADQPAQAQTDFLAALGANPRNLYALRDLARAHQRSGELLEATTRFKQALQLKPEEFQTRSELIDLLLARKQIEDALLIARDGIRFSPSFATSYDALARVHGARQDWPAAMDALRDGLQREPEHFFCNLRLGALLLMTDDACGAVPHLRAAAQHAAAPSEPIRLQAQQQLQAAQAACAGN